MRERDNEDKLNSANRLKENSRESNHVPSRGSRLEISILNLAHGEEPSNYDMKSEEMDPNGVNPIDPNNIQEEGTHNVKFKAVKNHGLKWPWHPQQMGTWAVMTILVLSFYLFLVPGTYYIGTFFVVLSCLVYGALLFGVVIFCLRATLTDPTDRNVTYERE